jgi:glycine/D-amino acid oxidase-like deaminating enzyme
MYLTKVKVYPLQLRPFFYQSLPDVQISGIRGALSCHTYKAARLWPYRLVAHLLKLAVSMGVNLQTFTPVTSVAKVDSTSIDQLWLVNTPRGSVKTKTVIYATNGYTSALVPEIKGKIVPVRGIVARLVGDSVPKLKDSYMIRISDYEYDYMIPRPDGSIIVGGGKRDYYKDLDEWFDVSDDNKLIEKARNYFDGYMQRHFHGWEDSSVHTEEIWTGSKHTPRSAKDVYHTDISFSLVMGYSNDGFPYVGPVCGRPGQYICAGFTGHGMPQIFLSAKAVASMVVEGKTEEMDLPVPYHISESRWFQPKEHASLKMWRQVTKEQSAWPRL